MSNQVQCPNCGGYKVSESIDRVDPTTGNKAASGGCGIFILFFIVSLLLAVFGTLSGNNVIGYSGIALMLLVAVPLIIRAEIRKDKSQKRAYNLYKYQCSLCGYNWDWQEGRPRPKINVRPDLIAKGEQRLEEERRKQQEDAAALYYLTHQGKK